MIRSFKNSDTQKVWNREHVPRLGPDLQRAAQKKLRLLNAAEDVEITDYHRREIPMTKPTHEPITPGEILRTEFLEPLGITQYRLAQATRLPQTRISEIVRGKRAITPGTALRLSRALGVDDHFWINIQTDYDLEIEQDRHAAELAQVIPLVAS